MPKGLKGSIGPVRPAEIPPTRPSTETRKNLGPKDGDSPGEVEAAEANFDSENFEDPETLDDAQEMDPKSHREAGLKQKLERAKQMKRVLEMASKFGGPKGAAAAAVVMAGKELSDGLTDGDLGKGIDKAAQFGGKQGSSWLLKTAWGAMVTIKGAILAIPYINFHLAVKTLHAPFNEYFCDLGEEWVSVRNNPSLKYLLWFVELCGIVMIDIILVILVVLAVFLFYYTYIEPCKLIDIFVVDQGILSNASRKVCEAVQKNLPMNVIINIIKEVFGF